MVSKNASVGEGVCRIVSLEGQRYEAFSSSAEDIQRISKSRRRLVIQELSKAKRLIYGAKLYFALHNLSPEFLSWAEWSSFCCRTEKEEVGAIKHEQNTTQLCAVQSCCAVYPFVPMSFQ